MNYNYSLTKLRVNQKAVVSNVNAGFNAKRRLADLGILPGSEILLEQVRPGYKVKVKGSTWVIGRGLARKINVHFPLEYLVSNGDYLIDSFDKELPELKGLSEGCVLKYKGGSFYLREEDDLIDRTKLLKEHSRTIYVIPLIK